MMACTIRVEHGLQHDVNTENEYNEEIPYSEFQPGFKRASRLRLDLTTDFKFIEVSLFLQGKDVHVHSAVAVLWTNGLFGWDLPLPISSQSPSLFRFSCTVIIFDLI